MFYLTQILQLPTGASKYAKKDATTQPATNFPLLGEWSSEADDHHGRRLLMTIMQIVLCSDRVKN